MKKYSEENYLPNPYKLKRIFLFTYGIYYDGTILYYGGYSRMYELEKAMNFAFYSGIIHCITVNEE